LSAENRRGGLAVEGKTTHGPRTSLAGVLRELDSDPTGIFWG
jgi:hypothetical protein